jgi:hypothetical protein
MQLKGCHQQVQHLKCYMNTMNLSHQLTLQLYHLAQLDQETFNLDMEVVWELFIPQPKLIRSCDTIFITFFIIWVFLLLMMLL